MGKRRGADQEAAQESEQQADPAAQAPPAAAPSGGMDPQVIAQLKDLGQLRKDGVLTDQEFDQQKAKLLA
jgi:hypothetical protein